MTAAHVALAVVVGDLLGGRLRRRAAEVPRRRRQDLAGDRVLRLVAVALGVGVHVDRDDPLEIQAHAAGSGVSTCTGGSSTPIRLRGGAHGRAPVLGDLLARSSRRRGSASRHLGRVRPQRQPVTADADGLAGHLRARLGGQEDDQRRAVLRHADRVRLAHLPRDRLAGGDALDERRVERDRRGHLRPRGGNDRVDRDRAARQLHRPRAREGDDARLRRGVVGLAEVAALACRRADDDDAPAFALLAHLDRGGARAREGAAQVRVNDQVEVLVGHLPQHLVAQHARVGHDDVEPPEGLDRASDQRLRRSRVPHGTGQGHRRAAVGGDRRDRLLRRGAVEVVDHHARARCGERDRVGAPEPAPRAGDDRDLAVDTNRAHA